MLKIANHNQIARAKSELVARLTQGANVVRRDLGWPGGGKKIAGGRVLWRRKDPLWAYFHPDTTGRDNPQWNCWYGLDLLQEGKAMVPEIEINMPVTLRTRHGTGRVLIDERGNAYLGHKGELKGGRSGVVSLAEFAAAIQGFAKEQIEWPDGGTENVYIIGRIGARDFLARLQKFVAEAHRIRKLKRDRKLDAVLDLIPGFKRGTSGRTKGRRTAEYDIERSHEIIVNALHDRLEGHGVYTNNKKHRGVRPDLYSHRADKTLDVLFEVKTGDGLGDLYTAIGQLCVYAAAQDVPPRRLLVSRGMYQDPNYRAALRQQRIDLLQFKVAESGEITFPNFESLFPATANYPGARARPAGGSRSG
jgi:hypothetical protein